MQTKPQAHSAPESHTRIGVGPNIPDAPSPKRLAYGAALEALAKLAGACDDDKGMQDRAYAAIDCLIQGRASR
jgi:hypothetical protein